MMQFTEAENLQRNRLFAADEEWWGDFLCDLDDDGRVCKNVTPAALTEIAEELLMRVGWTECRPIFELDVADDDPENRAGYVDVDTGVIHIHPLLVAWDTFLHEVSHWLDVRDGHGPRFCAIQLELVLFKFGDAAYQSLSEMYEASGVRVDRDWLESVSIGRQIAGELDGP